MSTLLAPPTFHTYEPRGAACQLFGQHDPAILMQGPAGTGKTRGVLEKINGVMCKYPGSRAAIIRKTKTSMTQTVLVTFEEKVLPRNPEYYPVVDDVKRENRKLYRYPNGSEIFVGGMDNPDRIMSAEFDIIGIFEGTELTLDDFEKCTTRLRNNVVPYQQTIVDCNPGAPSHWLNKRAEAKLMERLFSHHVDNPTLWDESLPKLSTDDPEEFEFQIKGNWTPFGRRYIAILNNLSGARFLRLRRGKWAQAEGVVYDAFNQDYNVITAANAPKSMLIAIAEGERTVFIPPAWRRIRVIDFGYTNPFVCQWWAIDPDGRMYLYRELYGTGRTVGKWAPLIKSLSEGENIEATISDHDAEDRATLHEAGIITAAAMKSLTPGIQAVTDRIPLAGDGRPRLMFMADALVEADQVLKDKELPLWSGQEIEAYSWPKGADGKAAKEAPDKKYDHGMDAMRYAVAYVDNVGRESMTVRVIGGGSQTAAGIAAERQKTATKRSTDHLWKNL